MVTEIEFLVDIAVVLGVAALVTVIFKRINQPVVFGFIVAGIIIGPFTPPFSYVHDIGTIQLLAELGLIMLLFSLGLEFNIGKLRKVGVVALLAGTIEMIVMIAIGFYLGQLFGWSTMDSIFLGAILSISSTAIIIKVLSSMRKMQEKTSQIIFGMLIIEDLGAIVLITILSGIGTEAISVVSVGETLGRIALFIFVFIALGLAVVPRLINYIGRLGSDEVLIVSVLGLAFGIAFFTHYLGFSTATGAFLIGAVIAESRIIGKVIHLMNPIRDVFAAIFFVTIGILFDYTVITMMALPIAIITAMTILGKIASCSMGVMLAGYDGKTGMRVGMGMSQIGEFSFIIAKIGQDLRLTSAFLFPIAVFVSVVTSILTPYLIKWAPNASEKASKAVPIKMKNTFAYYSQWTDNIRDNLRTARRQRIRRISTRIFINLLVLAFISVITQVMFSNANIIADFLNTQLSIISTSIWVIGVVLAIFPILRLAFAISDIVNVLSSSGSLANIAMSNIVRKVLAVFIIGFVLIIIIPLLPIFETAAPTLSILTMVIIGSVGFLLKGKLHAAGEKMEWLFGRAFEPREEEEEARPIDEIQPLDEPKEEEKKEDEHSEDKKE